MFLLMVCMIAGLILFLWTLLLPKSDINPDMTPTAQATPSITATNTLRAETVTPGNQALDIPGTLLIVSEKAGRVYIAKGDSVESLQISGGDIRLPLPALSPDGTRIAYRDLSGHLNVYEISSQKTTLYPDVLMAGLWKMGWSPDGEHVAYGCPTLPVTICLYSLKTGKRESFPDPSSTKQGSSGAYTFAGWSENGATMGLLYYSDPPVMPELVRVYLLGTLKTLDLRTGTIADVLSESGLNGIEHIRDASLSPDGSVFLFCAKSGEYYSIFRVNTDGSGLSRVTPETLQFDIFNPIWKSDGQGFVADAPDQGNGSVRATNLPTIFDLSGKITSQIFVDEWGSASNWIGGLN